MNTYSAKSKTYDEWMALAELNHRLLRECFEERFPAAGKIISDLLAQDLLRAKYTLPSVPGMWNVPWKF